MRHTDGIIMPNVSKKHLKYVAKHVETFFPLSIKGNCLESKDRRFLMKSNGEILYHHDNRDKKTSLLRLMASLTFSKAKMFHVLRASNERKKIIPFSKEEKSVIRSFVANSNFPTEAIPCGKIRALCM